MLYEVITQPPAMNMDPQAFFEQSKAVMMPMMEQSLPGLNAVKECVQGAEDKAAFEKCVITSYSIHYTKLYESAWSAGYREIPCGYSIPTFV